MRTLFAALLAAAGIAAAPVSALAQAQAPDSGFTAALRVGYGIPMGSVFGNTSTGASEALSDQFSGQLPFWLDAGYRFNRNSFVGAYFQYGIAFVNDSKAVGGGVCDASGVSCSGSDVRLGAEFLYSISPEASFSPWAGLGFGYEWVNLDLSGGGATASVQFHGWEFFNLQVGGDFKVSPAFALGPYVAFSLGQYQTASFSGTGLSGFSGDIADKKIHEWLQFGVKGTFNL